MTHLTDFIEKYKIDLTLKTLSIASSFIDQIDEIFIFKKTKESDNAIINLISGLYEQYVNHNYVSAKRYYNNAFHSDINSNPDILHRLGCIQMINDKLNKAHKYLIMALNSDPDNVNILVDLALLYKIYNDQKNINNKYEKSFEYLQNNNDESNPHKLYMLGKLYEDTNNYDLAEKYYLVAADLNIFAAKYELANLYRKQNKMDLAEKYYKLAYNDCFNYINGFNNNDDNDDDDTDSVDLENSFTDDESNDIKLNDSDNDEDDNINTYSVETEDKKLDDNLNNKHNIVYYDYKNLVNIILTNGKNMFTNDENYYDFLNEMITDNSDMQKVIIKEREYQKTDNYAMKIFKSRMNKNPQLVKIKIFKSRINKKLKI